VLVISHLILNDMMKVSLSHSIRSIILPLFRHIMKTCTQNSSVDHSSILFLMLCQNIQVKGYINEMAVRIEDEDERISSLAKLFFHELSKKGTTICVASVDKLECPSLTSI
jgi:hypothetical protein